MKTKHTTLTTLAIITTLTLAACGHEERPQNPTYNPADSTYTTLPTKQLSPEVAEYLANTPEDLERDTSTARNRCSFLIVKHTTNPEGMDITIDKETISEPIGDGVFRYYDSQGTVNFTENGYTTTHDYICSMNIPAPQIVTENTFIFDGEVLVTP